SRGYIPFPLTIYNEVRKLEPGHVLTAVDGRVSIARYWQLRYAVNGDMTEGEAADRFLELFREAVASHLMSDVSLGAFLSGGVDSGLVVALMSECSSTPVKTFSIG